MKGLRSAIAFLTILPLGPRNAAEDFAAARTWFPLVGLVLGCLLAAADLLLQAVFQLLSAGTAPPGRPFPPLLAGALLTATLVLLTRALHLDGFMDSCDALLGGFERRRRLEILRDPRVGAFAVVGLTSLLLLKLTSLAALPQVNRQAVLLLFPCLARWGMLLAMEVFPYVRREGLGTAFLRKRGRWPLIGGLCFTLAASIGLAGTTGILLFALASTVAWVVGSWSARALGGLTGDIYGAVNETAEAAVLVVAAVLAAASPLALRSPLAGYLD
jgi:adenosylcobinamide-GDP ribazoletransferase